MNHKYLGAKEFRDEGFLQEANRLFFHPLGLALALFSNDEDGVLKVQVWDEREDPEGWFFAPGELSKDKIDNVEDLKQSKLAIRWAVTGREDGIQEYDTVLDQHE